MHDFHCHTNLSACAPADSTLKTMLQALKKAGVTTAGIANHIWDEKVPGASTWYAPQDTAHVLSVRKEYDALSEEERCGIKLFFGCETEYVGQGRVALKKASAKDFAFVLVPPHHFHMKNFVRPIELEDAPGIRRLMLARFIECCNIDFVTGLAHPFMVLGYPGREDEIISGITDDEFEKVFKYAAEKGKSIELNISCIHQKVALDAEGLPIQYRRMFTIARKCGCRFHLGSDAHTPDRLAKERFEYALKFADACGMVFTENPFGL